MTSDPTWLIKSGEGCHAIQVRTLIGPFLALSGLLREWVGPTDKLHPYNTPEEELRGLGDSIQQKLGICRVRGRRGGILENKLNPFSFHLQNEMFKVFQNILRCSETRSLAIDYLQSALSLNSRRAKLHVRYCHYVSCVNIMLKCVTVMLAVPILC